MPDVSGSVPFQAGRPLRPRRVPPHTLADVARQLGLPQPAGRGVPVTGLTHDSRAVQPGDLYAALPGTRAHGAQFAADAARAGAVACLTDPAGEPAAGAAGLEVLVVDDPRARLGALAAWWYDEPARALGTVGVTGTDGKTTTAFLLEGALRAAGLTTGLVGTITTRIAGRDYPAARTTPEAPDLQALLAVMREQGVDALALEVSSHALLMGRVNGLVVDVAVFTNLSQDHLDFHRTMEDYFAAKAMLFTPERARAAVICVDDPYGRRLAEQARGHGLPVTTVGRPTVGGRPLDPDVVVDPVGPRPGGGQRVRVTGLTGTVAAEVDLALPGRFNATNAALALVAASHLLDARQSQPAPAAHGSAAHGSAAEGSASDGRPAGEELARLMAGLAAVRVPGRMEVVPGGPPLGVVDFAHTPKAIATVLTELRTSTRGRLIVVLGAGGDRDRTKRPAMGEAAGRLADLAIVTDDNPRSEDPSCIRRAVLAGLEPIASARRVPVLEVADRAEAVQQAVVLAGPDDTVVVLGKGHEQGQEVAGAVRPFDDRQVLAQALQARQQTRAAEQTT